MHWAVGGVIAAVAGYGLFVGVRHGLSCQTSALHPNVKQVDDAVHKQLVVLQQLETGPNSQGWTRPEGTAALAADAALTTTLHTIRLSPDDRVTVDNYLSAVAQFDLRLTNYMAQDTVANQDLFGVAAKALQASTEDLSGGLYAIPKRCGIN
jgi:hypothetical protein